MNPRYFKEQICEELDGASCYLKKAIDCHKSNPEWIDKFVEMAEAEQHHATTLYKMFIEMYAETNGEDSHMSALRDSIMDCFSTKMRKIEDLKTTLSMMTHEEKVKETKTEQPKPWVAPTVSAESSTTKAISD